MFVISTYPSIELYDVHKRLLNHQQSIFEIKAHPVFGISMKGSVYVAMSLGKSDSDALYWYKSSEVANALHKWSISYNLHSYRKIRIEFASYIAGIMMRYTEVIIAMTFLLITFEKFVNMCVCLWVYDSYIAIYIHIVWLCMQVVPSYVGSNQNFTIACYFL